MAMCKSAVKLVVAMVAVEAHASGFVPACVAEQCSTEVLALGGDAYTSSLVKCTVDNFGPCASKAWECLGDQMCRKAASCAPRVFNTCKADIWKILTDPKEREMVMCIEQCPVGNDGHHNPLCVLEKCGKAAAQCLLDETCRDVVNCVPKAMMECSKSAFQCVFNSDAVCRDNLKCLGNGLSQCSAPGVNFLTDTRIADLVECAGGKCPHPGADSKSEMLAIPTPEELSVPAPIDAVTQLMCMEAKCPLKLPKILLDHDSKDLVTCVGKTNFTPIWECLGSSQCQNALSCWSTPLDTCAQDIWYVLTDGVERQRIEASATCLRACEKQHEGDFVEGAFCVLDNCSQGILDCYHDNKCRSAVKCLPSTAAQCSVPTLEAYASLPLFQEATKSLAFGLETCGRAAVEMLRDQNVAEAVRCAAQCTRAPHAHVASTQLLVV